MVRKNIKLLPIISILLIGFITGCSKPEFKLTHKITINEDDIIVINPINFRIINDNEFSVISNSNELNIYNLTNGQLTKSFTIIDSAGYMNIVNYLLKTEPKRDYIINANNDYAKKNLFFNLVDIRNYYFDGKNFYIYTYVLMPYMGYYEGIKMKIVSRATVLIKTDIDLNVLNVKKMTMNYPENIDPGFPVGFVKYNNFLYSLNSVELKTNKIDTLYPVISRIKLDNTADSIDGTPNFVENIYFPKNSFILKVNNSLQVFGNFNVCDDSLYVSVTNSIYNVNTTKKIFKVDENIKIRDFEVDNYNSILFCSYNTKTKKYCLNKKDGNGNIITKELNSHSPEIKIIHNCVYNNKIYLLTKDEEHYYVEEYCIN